MKTEYYFLLAGIILLHFATSGAGMDAIQIIAKAIMDFEGYSPGSVSYRNNNPGNLKNVGQLNVVGTDNQGHAIFPTFQDGWNALIKQVTLMFGQSSLYNPDMSLYQIFNRYAEANGNSYAQFVARRLGVTPETRLRELI